MSGTVPAGAAAPGNDEVTIQTAGQTIGGWESIRITRGVALMPPDFELQMTEKSGSTTVIAQPGDPIVVMIGGTPILTGYVDRIAPSIGAEGHEVYLTGRGMCEDLVDCAAIWPSNQIVQTSALDIATKLGKPYGIKVASTAGPGATVNQLNINLGESSWDIIERVTRYSGLLAYEMPDGSLRLATVGQTVHSSGATQGVNVEAASAVFSVDQRFSEYRATVFSFDRFSDLGTGGNTIAVVKDTTLRPGFGGAPRFRPRYVVSEQIQNGVNLAEVRAKWELARRYGQSNALHVEVDSWRDASAQLWSPNWLMPLNVPACRVTGQTWLIGAVSFTKNLQRGTIAALSLMPPQAFQPEPVFFNSLAWDVARDLQTQNNAKGGSGAP
jgi:prophage tail gpP-like protein